MSEASSRLTLSVQEGRLEIVGSEDFVAKQAERLEAVMQQLLNTRSQRLGAPSNPSTPAPAPNDITAPSNDLKRFENVFALADDKIQILKDIPGTGKAEKTVNVALLTAYGNMLRDVSDTSFDTIRDTCQAHGCLDGSNFAKTLRAEKDAFIIEGSERKKTLRLTVPGKRRAEELTSSLNDA